MHAQTIEAAQWWARPRGLEKDGWIASYQKSLTSRHRDAIVRALVEIQPGDLLELGCHCGPNLVRAARELPQLQSVGIDVSQEAIEAGRRWIQSEGFADRVQLHVARVPEHLFSLPSQSCDVVLSCYAMAYIAPHDIDTVLYEMGRLAAKAVIIAEPMDGQEARSLTGYSVWGHKYRERVEWINTLRGMTWGTIAVTPPVDALRVVLVGKRDCTP